MKFLKNLFGLLAFIAGVFAVLNIVEKEQKDNYIEIKQDNIY